MKHTALNGTTRDAAQSPGTSVNDPERPRSDAAVRESEAQFRALFTALDQGFCILEVLFDAEDVPVDYRFLETNPAFARQTGLVDAVGRTARELVPTLEAHWFELYGRVATTGETTRFDSGSDAMGRWFDVFAYRVGAPDARRVALIFSDVSAARSAERERDRLVAELSTERESLRSLILQMPAPVALLTGPEHRFTIVNDAFRRISGGGRDVTGLTPREASPHLDGSGLFERFDVVYESGEPWIGRETLVRYDRDGTGITDNWFDLRFEPVRDADGRVTAILDFAMDVTEQVRTRRTIERHLLESEAAWADAERARAEAVRAAAALAESETRYRELFSALDEGFCVLDVLFDDEGRACDYRYVEANPAFAQQTGLASVVGRSVRELVPGIESHWFEIYGRVATTGEPTRFQSGSDAMGRWFNLFAFRVGQPDDRRVAVLFTDITAAKAAERERERLLAELEVERSRLAEAFRRAPTFIATYRGPELRYEFVNEAYYQLVGHRDVLGKTLLDAIPETREHGWTELLARVRDTGEPWIGRESPALLQRTPGAPLETRYVDMVFQAMVEADGTRSGVVAHGSDVTEQVLARREIERVLAESEHARAEAEAARAEAESANRVKGEFLAVMSHELRTPLNAIGGYAELMEMGIRGPVTAQQREDLGRIQTSQRHLLGLINEVLNYAKLETGTVRYDLSDVRVRDSLAVAEGLVSPQARAKGLTLSVSVADCDVMVRADADKLRQILVNLLSNAVKFTGSGGRIDVGCAVNAGRAQVTIRDTGIGIPGNQLERIFEPFVQVRSDLTRPHEGTGLGLAISRDLARAMGGELRAESAAPGAGSTFTLTLPVTDGAAPPATPR